MNFPETIKIKDTADVYIRHNTYSGASLVVCTRIAFDHRIAIIFIAVCNLIDDTLKSVHKDKIYLVADISQEEGEF